MRRAGLVEFVVLVDVEVADLVVLGRLGRHGFERGSSEELELDVLRVAAEGEEPALAFVAVERLVPFHGLVYVGDGAHDELVEPLAQRALPTWHGCDEGLHRLITLSLRDLWVPPESSFGWERDFLSAFVLLFGIGTPFVRAAHLRPGRNLPLTSDFAGALGSVERPRQDSTCDGQRLTGCKVATSASRVTSYSSTVFAPST
jgi:hypothetical protein